MPAFPVASVSAVPASRGEARQRLTYSSRLCLCAIKFETKGFLVLYFIHALSLCSHPIGGTLFSFLLS